MSIIILNDVCLTRKGVVWGPPFPSLGSGSRHRDPVALAPLLWSAPLADTVWYRNPSGLVGSLLQQPI